MAEPTLNRSTGSENDDRLLINLFRREIDNKDNIGAIVTVGVLKQAALTQVEENERKTRDVIPMSPDNRFEWSLNPISGENIRYNCELRIQQPNGFYKIQVRIIKPKKEGSRRYVVPEDVGINCIRYLRPGLTNTLKIKFDQIKTLDIPIYIRITVIGEGFSPSIFVPPKIKQRPVRNDQGLDDENEETSDDNDEKISDDNDEKISVDNDDKTPDDNDKESSGDNDKKSSREPSEEGDGEWVDVPTPANHYEIVTDDGSVFYRKENLHYLPEFLKILLKYNDDNGIIWIRDVPRATVLKALKICEEDNDACIYNLPVPEALLLLNFFHRYSPFVNSSSRFIFMTTFEMKHFPEYIARRFGKIRNDLPNVTDSSYFNDMVPVKHRFLNEDWPFSRPGLKIHKDISAHLFFYKSVLNDVEYLSFGMYIYLSGEAMQQGPRLPIKISFETEMIYPAKLSICRLLTPEDRTIGCPTLMPWKEYKMRSINEIDDNKMTMNVRIDRVGEDFEGLREMRYEPRYEKNEKGFERRDNKDLLLHHCKKYNSKFFYPSESCSKRITQLFYDILYHGTADITPEDIIPLLELAQKVECAWVKKYLGQALYNTKKPFPHLSVTPEQAAEYTKIGKREDLKFQQMDEFVKVINNAEVDETRDDVCVVYSLKKFVLLSDLT